jgi:hypothetical protein
LPFTSGRDAHQLVNLDLKAGREDGQALDSANEISRPDSLAFVAAASDNAFMPVTRVI